MAAVGVDPVQTIGPPEAGRAGHRRTARRSEKTPYLLILPTLAAIVVTLGVPLYKIMVLAFQHQTKREFYQGSPATGPASPISPRSCPTRISGASSSAPSR